MPVYIGNTQIADINVGLSYDEDTLAVSAQKITNVVNGKWVCPQDWDDPYNGGGEPVDRSSQVIYLVFRTDIEQPYCSFRCNVAYNVVEGHFVNGEFVATSSPVAKTANNAYQKILASDYATSRKNTIVMQVTSTSNITTFDHPAFSINGVNADGFGGSCVIRYGNLPNTTNFPAAGNIQEVEDVSNLKVTSFLNRYNAKPCLKKYRNDGCNLFTATSFASSGIVDVDLTLPATCTSLTFSGCGNLRYLDASAWHTEHITSLTACFDNCQQLRKIDGLDTWDLSSCTAIYQMFSKCYSLEQDIDTTNWHLDNVSHSLGMQNMFVDCRRLRSIKFVANLTNVPTMSGMFSGCFRLASADFSGCTYSAPGKLTSIANMFQGCTSLTTLTGFFNNNLLTDVAQFAYLLRYTKLESVVVGQNDFQGTTSTNSNVADYAFGDMLRLKYLDVSAIDLSNYTYASSVCSNLIANDSELVDFYPPKNIRLVMWVSSASLLSRNSLLRLKNNLIAPSSSTASQKTIGLGTVNQAKLTEAERAEITTLGWTIS